MSDNWQNDVRIHYDHPGEVSYLEDQRQRSDAQKLQDQILDKAAEHAETALEHVYKALDYLVVIEPGSRHQDAVVPLKRLQERVSELRRIRQ